MFFILRSILTFLWKDIVFSVTYKLSIYITKIHRSHQRRSITSQLKGLVKWYTRISRHGRPLDKEGDKGGDEKPESVNPLAYRSRTCCLYIRDSRMRGLWSWSSVSASKRPSAPAVNEIFKEATKEYAFVPTSEPQLNEALTVQEAIRGFEIGKSSQAQMIYWVWSRKSHPSDRV